MVILWFASHYAAQTHNDLRVLKLARRHFHGLREHHNAFPDSRPGPQARRGTTHTTGPFEFGGGCCGEEDSLLTGRGLDEGGLGAIRAASAPALTLTTPPRLPTTRAAAPALGEPTAPLQQRTPEGDRLLPVPSRGWRTLRAPRQSPPSTGRVSPARRQKPKPAQRRRPSLRGAAG